MKTIGILTAYAHKIYTARPELIDSLKNEGYNVIVFGLEEQELGEKNLNKHNLKYISIPVERKKLNPFAEVKSSRYLAQQINENKVDLLFSYGIRLVPLCDNAAKKAGIPVVNTINGAGTLFGAEGLKGRILRMMIIPVIRKSIRYAEKVIFQNKDDYNMFKDLNMVTESQYVLVNGSGVNISRYAKKPLPNTLSFGFDCRITPEKGVYELLQAFDTVKKNYPEAQLNIAGALDGLEKSEIMAMFNEFVEKGKINYFSEISDISTFLEGCRFFVFPSYYREGTPRSVLEALACGRPVITTDAPGCRETVVDGENGILVRPKDVKTLTEAMLEFCEKPDMVEEMSAKSRKLAEDKFDVNKINKTIIEMFKSIFNS